MNFLKNMELYPVDDKVYKENSFFINRIMTNVKRYLSRYCWEYLSML